ncbi:MAG TPA: AAA family ATPase [Bryobacteraceae bacterium]|nr:AAA family ATPase [Bryobacteraceae bacterium]
MSPCKIVLAVGLPGSGKSTYFDRIGVNAISSDAIRLQLADDPTNQTIHRRVFAAVRYLLRQRLALRRPVTFIDATNLTVKERRRYIKVARDYKCDIEALYFDVSPEICKSRNAVRSRVVPPEAIDRMAAKLTRPNMAEGFTRVEIVTG